MIRRTMRAIGLLMITTILLAPLAGCAGTDGEVTVDLSTEELQEIIDDNKDDFLNNTTVVVFQEYYNNTTTNIDQSGGTQTSTYNYNGTDSNEIRMFTVQWNPEEEIGDPVNMQLTRPICENYWDSTCQEWDYGYDSLLGDNDALIDNYDISTIYVYQYNGQIVEISATCEEYYRYYNWDGDQWRDYLVDNYGYSSSQIYDAGYDLENKFRYRSNSVYQSKCSSGTTDYITLFDINLEIGMALEFLAHPSLTIDINCDDGFSTGYSSENASHHSDYHYSHLWGGQANCTVSGLTMVSYQLDGVANYNNNSSNNSDDNGDGIPDDNGMIRSLEIGEINHIVSSFAVYFKLHPVVIHQ